MGEEKAFYSVRLRVARLDLRHVNVHKTNTMEAKADVGSSGDCRVDSCSDQGPHMLKIYNGK